MGVSGPGVQSEREVLADGDLAAKFFVNEHEAGYSSTSAGPTSFILERFGPTVLSHLMRMIYR